MAIISLVYISVGVYKFCFVSGLDLKDRWRDVQYVLRGINPHDVYFTAKHPSVSDIEGWHLTPPFKDLGIPPSSYPPWSHGIHALFLFSDFHKSKWLWAASNIFFILGIAFLVWKLSIKRGIERERALLISATVIACSGFCSNLGLGQNGILILFTLLLSIYFLEYDFQVLSGLAIGFAMVKPNLIIPILLVYCFRKRWKALLTMLFTLAVFCFWVWIKTSVSPLQMLIQARIGQIDFYHLGSGPHRLINYFIATPMAMIVTPLLIGWIALPISWSTRQRDTMVAVGALGVIGRTWSYAATSSNVIIYPLLIALLWIKEKEGWEAFKVKSLCVYLLILSLILPARFFYSLPTYSFQFLVWYINCALLLFLTRQTSEEDSVLQ